MRRFGYIALCVLLASCVEFKKVDIFDSGSQAPVPPHIENFYALNVLSDHLSGEVWFTEDAKCIEVRNESQTVYSGEGSLYLKWNKTDGGCDWIGLGIGWNGWASKDMSAVLNKAAIRFKAKSNSGKINSLPLAVSLEDYGGNAAWLGLFPEFITYIDGEDWATITLPLERFGWNEFGADASNIKQMIIQFEASGECFIDAVSVVPYEGLRNATYRATIVPLDRIVVDGELTDWNGLPQMDLGEHKVSICSDSKMLYVSGSITDPTPMLNSRSGKEAWNGDAIELAIGVNHEAAGGRTKLLLSDRHFILRASNNPELYDVSRDGIKVPGALTKLVRSEAGYRFEFAIPLTYFGLTAWSKNAAYPVEIAVDLGDESGRKTQVRWNSPNREGFHNNPSLWGNLVFN
ncbi:MAG: hypothetical protein H6606_01395 [Flavobacteriales bacterium]|nr:hypothetical protein [Flavobacteriales bacterium]